MILKIATIILLQVSMINLIGKLSSSKMLHKKEFIFSILDFKWLVLSLRNSLQFGLIAIWLNCSLLYILFISHIEFIKKFKKYFLSSFNAYSSLDSERLFMIKPLFIQRWNYIDGKPIIEQFFIDQCKYIEKKYNTTS